MTTYGAFNPPATMQGGIEHIFARSDGLSWVPDALAGIRERGRIPLLTIEPWDGLGETIAFVRRMAGSGPLWLRYGHEFNGTWYPWTDPGQLKADWRAIRQNAPTRGNVRLIFCPNIHYLGASEMTNYWPGDGVFDAIGLDGYDQINGAAPLSFYEVFQPTITLIQRMTLPKKMPLWVCETATPRRHAERPGGAGQAGWINDLKHDAKRLGIDTVVWLSEDTDTGKWALGPAGAKALFGKASDGVR